ncbi:SulP family inorganic anion transporter [Bermanella marisrubri]|uniref:SulP family inorganic anion transporter n=1 Tax=Bermanella marisrubri TaxID=207949 RepID=UPI001402F646|nr:SulP family inorganic anion transporter [Bermanella marisrubri]QIZ84534.1 SulP family inorganic anion transporter [Bermanella marisrubri]
MGNNLSAGIIVAFLIIPQAIGYGLLANVPANIALAAATLPLIAYALFGGSRSMAVGPVAIVSLMVAEATTDMSANEIALSVPLLALMVGTILLTIRFLSLGKLVNFIGHPVIQGFTSAAAVLIIFKQLELMLGLPSDVFNVNTWHLPSLLLSTLSLISLIIVKGFMPSPLNKLGPLMVLLAGMIIALNLPNLKIETIGYHATGDIFTLFSPWNQDTNALSNTLLTLLPSAVIISVLVFLESTSVAKVVAKKHDERISPNQELMGLGSANIIAGFSGAFPVAGGFGRTMVNEEAGSTSPLAGVFTALFVLLFINFIPESINYMMKPVLGAIIAMAVWSLIDLSPLYSHWKIHPQDNAIWLASFLGVFILGVESGIMIGVGLSIAFLLRNAAHPHIAIIGRIPNTSHFRNVRRHKVETHPHVLAIRIDEGLTFANAENIEDFIARAIFDHPKTRHLLLVFSAVNQIDSDGLERLESIIRRQKKEGILTHLAEVKGPIMDKLQHLHLEKLLAPGQIYMSTHEAFEALENQNDNEHKS